MTVTAGLLSIGDELLVGAHPDLNAPHVARVLGEYGVTTREVHVLGDDEQELARRMAELCARCDLVVTTGGLGPTLDDVTRHAAASAAGVALELSDDALEQVRRWFAQRGREMSPSNERQALLPAGATLIPNAHGTAPGFRLPVGASQLVCLPGPPRELQGVLEDQVIGPLRELGLLRGRRREHTFHLCGLPESEFAELVGEWMARDAVPTMGVTAKGGVLSAHLRLASAAGAAEEALLLERVAAFRQRFAGHVFSEDQPKLELALGAALIARGVSVTFAESCTAGLTAARLARAPGVSAVLSESFVTYSDRAKRERLGVPADLLARYGAVSEPVAAAMAEGAVRLAGAALGVAISGIAGPSGGSPEKPVGTVCFGVHAPGAPVPTRTVTRVFPPVGRDAVRSFAATMALDLARRALDEGV